MGQQEMVKLLEKYPTKWFNIEEISKKLKIRKSTSSRILTQLKKYGEVFWKTEKIDGIHFGYLYKFKESYDIGISSL